MTESEAIRELKRMYGEGKLSKRAATMVHLFGVKYADELEGMPLRRIAEQATGSASYGQEIYKGMKLAAYVTVK